MRDWIQRHPWLMACLALVAVGAAIRSVFFPGAGATGRPPTHLEHAVGVTLGRAVADELPAGGDLLLLRRDTEDSWFRKKADAQVRGVREALQDTPVTIAAIVPEPLRPREAAIDGPAGIPLKRFLDLLEDHPGIDAVVSFVGAPAANPEDLPASAPPLFVAGDPDPEQIRWVDAGRAAAWVLDRGNAGDLSHLTPDAPAEAWFEAFHLLATPETADEVYRFSEPVIEIR